MSRRNWKIPYCAPHVPEALAETGCPPLLAALLVQRGILDSRTAETFLRGGEELLADPLLLTDMPLAVGRIARAIAAGEHVAVYGDYDVDGITSACLLTDYLRGRGLTCELYIPDRISEGYGLNTGAIAALAEMGVTLIVTVDCGVTAIEEADFAAELGVDMIITDHHECQGELPNAVAVVDPKRPDCNYPSRDLAGVGVAFKLVCAIDGSSRRILERYCDLIAVGTVADVMPLMGENRYIIREGLKKLAAAPGAGLAALMEESGASEKKLTASTIGFTLAPRLNAAGRLGRTALASDLLLSTSPARCRALAAELCELNRERQVLEQEIWEEAMALLRQTPPAGPIVLAQEGWHQGVIGIAASRLTEAFSLPAVMICLDGENGKGSCRSFGGFNLFEALSACSEYLEGFGGHALAAGLTIRRENIPAFREALAKYYDENPPVSVPELSIDLVIEEANMLGMESVEALELMEPFGNGNPRPLLCLRSAVLESVSPIGGGKHLRLRLSKNGEVYEAVFFSHTEEELGAAAGMRVDVAFFPQINEFRQRRSVQLLITDVRPADYTVSSRAILESAELTEPFLAPYAPDRSDFARAWRRITALGGVLEGPLDEALRRLEPVDYEKHPADCACLRVFAETGLIELQFSGDTLTIRQKHGADKVDLSTSRLLRNLSGEV